jgi:hypothetical protein
MPPSHPSQNTSNYDPELRLADLHETCPLTAIEQTVDDLHLLDVELSHILQPHHDSLETILATDHLVAFDYSVRRSRALRIAF